MAETLVLTRDEAQSLVYEDLDGYEVVETETISSTRRETGHQIIVRRLSDGKYFMDTYSKGTGDNGYEPYEYEAVDFVEVQRVEVVTTKWVVVP